MTGLWTKECPASIRLLSERVQRFTQPRIDHERNLQFPDRYPRENREDGFDFVVGPSIGGGIWLHCSGFYEPVPGGTRIGVRFRPHRHSVLLCGLVGLPFGLVLLWAFWPINMALALGSCFMVATLMVVYIKLSAYGQSRWVWRHLEAALSSDDDGGRHRTERLERSS